MKKKKIKKTARKLKILNKRINCIPIYYNVRHGAAARGFRATNNQTYFVCVCFQYQFFFNYTSSTYYKQYSSLRQDNVCRVS